MSDLWEAIARPKVAAVDLTSFYRKLAETYGLPKDIEIQIGGRAQPGHFSTSWFQGDRLFKIQIPAKASTETKIQRFMVDSDWMFAAPSPEGMVAHEVGHALLRRGKGLPTGTPDFPEVDGIIDALKVVQALGKRWSDTADASAYEAACEGFAAFVTGQSGPHVEIGRALHEYGLACKRAWASITHTAGKTRTLYRGLSLGNAGIEDIKRDAEEYLLTDVLQYKPLGIHWTDDFNSAYNFATDRDAEGWAQERVFDGDDEIEDRPVGVVLVAEVNESDIIGRGTEEFHNAEFFDAVLDYSVEREVLVRDHASVRLKGATFFFEDFDGRDKEEKVNLGISMTAAVDEPGFLGFRGVSLMRVDVEEALGGQVEKAAPRAVAEAILKVLDPKLGQHWTTVLGVAAAFAETGFTEDIVSVVLAAAIPMQSIMTNPPSWAGVYPGSDEFERFLKSGARVELTKVCYLTSTGKWIEVVVTDLPPKKAAKKTERIDYCKVCGSRIQKIDTWKHQRPQPSGESWDHQAVPGGKKTATLFNPSQMRSWEQTRPWNLSRAEAESQMVDGWWGKQTVGTESASWEKGYIRPAPEFYSYPEGTKRAIAYHEAGHAMLEAAGGLRALDDPLGLIEWPGASILGYNVEEIVAEAYSVLWTEPSWFVRHGARQILDLVIKLAHTAGYPLP